MTKVIDYQDTYRIIICLIEKITITFREDR